jgi:hypothetical protein
MVVHHRAHRPDTAPDVRLRLKENTLSSDTYPTPSGTARVPRVGECADKALSLPAIHLREEPDALTSARPGPSGGYHVSGIPTRDLIMALRRALE